MIPILRLPEVQFAIEAVRQTSLLTEAVQGEMKDEDALTKSDDSPVTVADLGAQAVIAAFLEKAFPNDILVGEEDAGVLRSSKGRLTLGRVVRYVQAILPQATAEGICDWIDRGKGEPGNRFWTVDPIDGTKGFLRKDQYAVALALLIDGKIEVGVLGCPVLREARYPEMGGPGSLVIAVRGKGSWTAPLKKGNSFSQLHVSDHASFHESILVRPFDTSHTNLELIEKFQHLLGIETPPVLLDSLSKYAVLASGGGDIYLRLLSPQKMNYKECIWDQAPGSIILEEAGGKVTDLDGKPLDYTTGRRLLKNRGAVSSNGKLHAMALEVLRKLL
ncbi:MAG: 3'(2'),5'-bisphosphate nucleotidase [Chlamydiae bacterium]|nr:3'(2'),5'-bisphosphate nucleotidase [Chlamydiota bacterium]MBI3276557.1 3'(2'),5'-bisphosphate nucleotidase [Chlamydiota bacterium]